MVRNTILLICIVSVMMLLLSTQVLRYFKVSVPMWTTVVVSVLAAAGGALNTLKEDSGLSFLGHFIISTILATCILGAVAGFFTLTGQLPGLPRWIAITLLIGGIL